MSSITLIPSTGTAACVPGYAFTSLSTIEPARNAASVEAGAHLRVRPGGVDECGPQRIVGLFPTDEQTKVQTLGADKRAAAGPSPWRPPE